MLRRRWLTVALLEAESDRDSARAELERVRARLDDAKAQLVNEQRESAAQQAERVRLQQLLLEESDLTDAEEPTDGAAAEMARQVLRIQELERELGQVKDERDEIRRNFELSLAERADKHATANGLGLAGNLQAGNQRLRAQLRTEADRANRAETRIAGLELAVQTLAQAHTGQKRPTVVVVDGEEIVVPWSARA